MKDLTEKTLYRINEKYTGFRLGWGFFRVSAGRFLICFFEVHNRQNRHAWDRPFALFPSADRSLVRAGMVPDAKGN